MKGKLQRLQSELEAFTTEQRGLIDKAEGKNEKGEERGYTPEEDARFKELSELRKTKLKEIERQKEVEALEAEEILLKGVPAPAIHTEKKEFSLAKAVRSAITGKWDDAGLEKETMQENARIAGRVYKEHGLFLDPNMVFSRADAASVAGTASDGGNLVGTQYRGDKLVDQLWNETILSKLPVVSNLGLKQNQSIPTVTSKVTATMVGEISDTGDKEKITFGLKTATPKEMVTVGAFSRLLDIQSEPTIRNIFKNQVMKAIAYKLDDMFIEGSGVAPLLTGILGLTSGGGADQTKTIALGTNGAALTYANLVQMKTELAKKNVSGNLYFLTNGQVTGTLMTTLKDTANTASGYIMGENQNTLLRFPIVESQTIPYDLTKGSASGVCSAIILGKFDETEIFQWGNLAIEFDPYTMADLSQIVIRSFSFWDFIHKRPENYVIIKDVLTTA